RASLYPTIRHQQPTTLLPYTTLFRSHSRPVASTKGANSDAPAIQIQAVLSQPAIQLAWSPVSNTLAVGGKDGQVVLWSIRAGQIDRKSTRLNSSHQIISYAVFCLKKK